MVLSSHSHMLQYGTAAGLVSLSNPAQLKAAVLAAQLPRALWLSPMFIAGFEEPVLECQGVFYLQ